MPNMMEGVDRRTRIAGQNRLELLLFGLGGEQRFGINVFKVREVLKCPPIRPVPNSNPNICGFMHTRGQTVAIINLSAVLGLVDDAPKPDDFVIITEYNNLVQGYRVRQVERIVNLRWDQVHPPPAGIGDEHYLTAVATINDQLIEILDVERVLSEIMPFDGEVAADLAGSDPYALANHAFVADDSVVARKQITHVLDQLGFTYDVAENGRQAWEMLKSAAAQHPGDLADVYSLVISDIEMPEMDGYTLTKLIKADPALKNLYVCLHSSLSGSFNQRMVESVGADRFVPKFVADELATVIRQALGEDTQTAA